MADRVFSLDLGNSFAKVGLRRGRWATSELVADVRLTGLEELHVCVPTDVAVNYATIPGKPIFGDTAIDTRPQKGLRVFRNWKKDLFAEAAKSVAPRATSEPAVGPARTPSPVERLIHSAEFVQFAGRHGVSAAEVAGLRQLVTAAGQMLGSPTTGEPPPTKTAADTDAFKVAVLFLRHLRRVVLEVCKTQTDIPNPELIPARLAVPAFAPEKELPAHPGCRWLAEALTRAGWSLAAHRPIVSEPYANAVGILTRGSNCNREKDMLQSGMLHECLRKPKDHAEYRAVVIDVGAFTVDLTALTYRPDGDQTLEDVEFERRELSIPLGVGELDERVLGVLPHRQATYLRGEAPAYELMGFRTRLYSERQSVPNDMVGEIAAGSDGKRVEEAIEAYTEQLARQAAAFFDGLPDVAFKELILTGGGSTIPAVRDALIRGAEAGREKFRKIHLPLSHIPGTQRKTAPPQLVVTLDGRLTRGGTALGGSSVYFDMNREPFPIPAA